MTILLVRHAESAGNADHTVYNQTADHSIPLTEKGRAQAHDAGIFIQDYFDNNPPQQPARLWSSPYMRATQTALILQKAADKVKWDHSARGSDIHFDERLREREWGSHQHNDYETGRMKEYDPHYHDHFYKVWKSPQGRFFMRPHGGESAADVASRLRSFFHDLYFDINRGITDHVIVTHGLTMLAFVYAFTKGHPLFFDEEKFGSNTAVRLLDKDTLTGRYADYGFVYEPAHNTYLLNRPDKPIIRDVKTLLKDF